MAKKQKYYVVWQGHKPGIYLSWNECLAQVKNYPGARYKSFESMKEAEAALEKGPEAIRRSTADKAAKQKADRMSAGKPIPNSVSVDAACSGNPGTMEYQGVWTHDKSPIFHNGPYPDATNNIGEFLAIVHALAMMKKSGKVYPIYTDSKTSMAWVRNKHAKTTLARTRRNGEVFELIERAEKWLKSNDYSEIPIIKWNTRVWGEIPADFGRK